MPPSFSVPLLRALAHANAVAIEEFATLGITVPLFLYTLVNDHDIDVRETDAVRRMMGMGLPLDMMASMLRMRIPTGEVSSDVNEFAYAEDFKVILDLAPMVAGRMGTDLVRIEHVLVAILEEDDEWGPFLEGCGLSAGILLPP